MNTLKVGFGLVLSYPIYVLLMPVWVDGALSRLYSYLAYSNPTYAEIAGAVVVPNMMFVILCVGLGLIIASSSFGIISVFSDFVRAFYRLFSQKRAWAGKAPDHSSVQETKNTSSVQTL